MSVGCLEGVWEVSGGCLSDSGYCLGGYDMQAIDNHPIRFIYITVFLFSQLPRIGQNVPYFGLSVGCLEGVKNRCFLVPPNALNPTSPQLLEEICLNVCLVLPHSPQKGPIHTHTLHSLVAKNVKFQICHSLKQGQLWNNLSLIDNDILMTLPHLR